jgi:nicotinate-nucleotide adenylyltransferase
MAPHMPYHERMEEAPNPGRRIAFFGGSFDPPHFGHIGIARAAQQALQLDTVLFAPVGIQPLKPHGSTASYEDRTAMTELAIRRLPQFAISFVDAPDPTGLPNYTIDTLRRLQHQFPAAKLYQLMGADSFLSLRHWFHAADVPFAAPMIVASRPRQKLDDLAAALPDGLAVSEESAAEARKPDAPLRRFILRNAVGSTVPFYLLPGLEIEISATEIRQQVGAALDRLCAGHELLPDSVCDYIASHGLYR